MYYQITLKVPKDKAQIVEDFLYANISQGWETIEKGSNIVFNIFVEENSSQLSILKSFLAKYLEIKAEHKVLEDKDWAEAWKISFKPLAVGNRLIIAPPWEKPQNCKDKIIIIIKPALAFGTGHHPTTQMMLENIEIYMEKIKNKVNNLKILDLGCGTGILGITCAKLFENSQVWAIDIDDEAIRACKENIKLNNLKNKFIIQKDIPCEKFDLILANIGYRELKNLANSIRFCSKSGTTVFLSGVVNWYAQEIINIYETLGYKVVIHKKKDGWSFLWLELN